MSRGVLIEVMKLLKRLEESRFAIFVSKNHILQFFFRTIIFCDFSFESNEKTFRVDRFYERRKFLFRHLYFPVDFIRRRLSRCIRARSTKIHKSHPACSSIKNVSVSSAWSVDRRRVTNDFNDLRTHGNTTLIYE